MVYYGFWYTAKMDALMAFIREAQKNVDGEVTLNLYKGNIIVAGRTSPKSLYDAGIASMEGGGSYNQTDAEGFLENPRPAPARARPRNAAEVLSGSFHRRDAETAEQPKSIGSARLRGSGGEFRTSRIVAEIWREPAFDFRARHSFAMGVGFGLIARDAIDGEVLALRMGEIQAADAGGRDAWHNFRSA